MISKMLHVGHKPYTFVTRALRNHHVRHVVQASIGMGIMTIGVMIAHGGWIINSHVSDLIGYALHGYGALPFLKWAENLITD